MAGDDITLWQPQTGALVPKSVVTPQQITTYARQLSERERGQVVAAFTSGSYEMGSVFLWNRTMAVLKKQLASLGMEFIGEMLDRPDITSGVAITTVVTDHEALSLAEELGMFSSTDALRLRHALELVVHFSDPPEEAEGVEMMPEDGMLVARACVQSVLGREHLEGALEFARFRRDLESRAFKEEDTAIDQLLAAPYFFQRTTLRVLVAQVKTTESAQLEHMMANLELILPLLWPRLAKPECWLVGRAYAEVHAAGKRSAASSIRRALMKVHGFDFVPEDLRSRTFIAAARRVRDAHFGTNNFYNEPEPMSFLASLGSTIPMPAFPACMSAVLCVVLGNPYGTSWNAVTHARETLARLTPERWRYYLDECLRGDDAILPKIAHSSIVGRWFDVVSAYNLSLLPLTQPAVKKLIAYSEKRDDGAVRALARTIYDQIRDKSA